VLYESPDITSPKGIIFLSPLYCTVQVTDTNLTLIYKVSEKKHQIRNKYNHVICVIEFHIHYEMNLQAW